MKNKIVQFLTLLILFSPFLLLAQDKSSKSIGSVGNGSLKNAAKIPLKGQNFKYFSAFSYYFLRRGYTHEKVKNTILQAYQTCEKTCPNRKFQLMECSRKKGGKMWPHWTHQNGLSADFMSPLMKNNRISKAYDWTGIWHYLLNYDENGKLNGTKNTRIDFETMANHILALDDAARKNGLRISKIILKINLKDDLFKTPSGKKLLQRNIYFARRLPKIVDDLHDDHYHVDFVLVN